MKNPERIVAQIHRASNWLTPHGWLIVYGLAAFMMGVLYAVVHTK